MPWSNWESLSGKMVSDPTTVSWGKDRVDVFVVGTDYKLYQKYWENGWSGGLDGKGPWNPINAPPGGIKGKPAASTWGINRLDIFARGKNDGVLYHKFWPGSRWSDDRDGFPGGWEPISSGGVQSDPAAVSWSKDRVDVLVQLSSDNNLYHKWWNGRRWSNDSDGFPGGWEPIGSPRTGPYRSPAVSSWGPNRLDVFAVGSDRRLYHKFWTGSRWSNDSDFGVGSGGWEIFNEIIGNPVETFKIVSDPSAVSWGANRIDIFVRGYGEVSNTTTVWRKIWGPGWLDWQPTGRELRSVVADSPAVSSWTAGRLDIFNRGTDDACYHKWWNE